ncbi:MAG: polyprenyl diphosphate synthase, partial [Deltaproteobacteria bacterium]
LLRLALGKEQVAAGIFTLLKKNLYLVARLHRNHAFLIQLAFNYGARREIVDAVRHIVAQVRAGALSEDAIDEATVAGSLYTAGLPDPDLLVRTSGEMRLSNFLLWQLCYTEIYVTKTCWPDFSKAEFGRAIRTFQARQRRFGGLHG